MLELIFQGFVEWCYGLTLECWEYFSSVLLDIMSMDFAYLRTHIPIMDTIMQIMLAVGWALLIGNLVFQAIKSMVTGLGFEGEDPKLLFTRTFVFAFLLLASPQICQLLLNMTSVIIDIVELPDAVNITFADEASFGGLAAAWILVVICGIVVMFQSFKLIFEMAERYFILAVLTITAPLAFGTGGSRNTSDIFTGWCRMYGSMCLMMVLNVVFVKMLLSALSFYPSGLDVLPWMVLIVTIVKVAKRADGIVTRIGLNPAITGDSLGRSFPGMLTYMVVRTAASNVMKNVGKSSGGAKGGKSPGTPPGGSGGGPKTGPASGSYGAAADARTTRQESRQSAAQQTSTQQSAAQQSSAAQSSEQHTASREQTAGPSFSASTQSQFNQSSTHKSAVPPGTRRAPSHIPKPSGMAGMRQNVKEGAVNSSMQAEERSSVSVGQPSPPGAERPGRPAAQPAAPTESRFTHREQTGPVPDSKPVQGGAQTPVAGIGDAARGGTAGSTKAPASDAARHGRNPATAAASGAAPSRPAAQARQEPARPAAKESEMTSKGASVRPGTAGTARGADRTAQTRRTATERATRAKSTPTATDSLGGKRMASSADAAQKGQQPKRSSKRIGGSEHGIQK